jgi:hypothetical protein
VLEDLRLLKRKIGLHAAAGEDRARLFEENCLLGRIKPLSFELGWSRAAAGSPLPRQPIEVRPEPGDLDRLRAINGRFGVVEVGLLEEPQGIRKRLLGCRRKAREAGRGRVSRDGAPSASLGHYDE